MAKSGNIVLGVLAAAGIGGAAFYGLRLKQAADMLSVRTVVRVHDVNVTNTTLSVDVTFINHSTTPVSFTYPSVRVYAPENPNSTIGDSIPRPERVRLAALSVTTLNDVRIVFSTLDLVAMFKTAITNMIRGGAGVIEMNLLINTTVAQVFRIQLSDTVKVDFSRYLALFTGFKGVGSVFPNRIATNKPTTVAVLASDDKTLVSFPAPANQIIGHSPQIEKDNMLHFQTLYGQRAVGTPTDFQSIDNHYPPITIVV